MKTCFNSVVIAHFLAFLSSAVYAQPNNIYELRKLSPDDWLEMSTIERLNALNTSNTHARNQTFLGNFNREFDSYLRWGYDYYDMNDSYDNYSFRGFESYRVLEDRRKKWSYNEFGDRIVKMPHNFTLWRDVIKDDGTSDVEGLSGYINHQQSASYSYRSRSGEGVWVARESTDDWAIAVIGAEKLRTILTPLTLSTPCMKGIKLDFQSTNYEASIINSIVAQHSYYTAFDNNVMLRGGQFRRKFGVLNLGITYSNMYCQQINREKGNDWKGTVNNYAPTPFIFLIRIVDDSPWDGDGPIVHDVKLKVNGVYRADIQPQIILDDITQEKNTADISSLKHNETNYLWRSNAFFGNNIYRIHDNLPKYVDYLFLNDWIRGWNTNNLTHYYDLEHANKYYKVIDQGMKPLQVSGTEYVVFLFDISTITDKVNRVEAEVTVSNDYLIQAAEIYTKSRTMGHDSEGANRANYTPTYWKTKAEAEGNVKDESNIRTIKLDFGYEVANIVYGIDAHYDYNGYKMRGEFVTNTHYYMFSDGIPGDSHRPRSRITEITPRTGYRSSITDHAYYFTAKKEWARLGFGCEYFKMGKFYRPYMDVYYPITDYYDTEFKRVTLIEDNDDYDQFPDSMDSDGVFPGQDLDKDGIPDTEKNRNGIPDYYEPFLMFDSDPDEFIFGDDFNNNTIPDYREDDRKYDTPYDLDRKGFHFFLRATPHRNVNFTIGSLRTSGVGVDNRTFNDYVKVKTDYNFYTIGNLFAEYRYEKIKDNVHDSFYVFIPDYTSLYRETSGDGRSLDMLEYYNSHVNKLFIESRIKALSGITIENSVKYERNRQIEGATIGGISQPSCVLKTMARVNKFSYTINWRNWTLSSGIKFRNYKRARSNQIFPEDHYMMRIPIIYLKYRVSPLTNITFGVQGFNGLESRYINYVNGSYNYRQKNFIMQFENKSNYLGFTAWGAWGFNLKQVDFDHVHRKFDNYKSSSFFVKVYIGQE